VRAAYAALGLLLSTAAARPVRADGAPIDSLSVRFEAGASTDVTNEAFYEDAFTDTTFLGRRLVSSPESRVAAVAGLAIQGTRDGRAESYALRNDLGLGDRVRSDALALDWRRALSPDWRLDVLPRAEYRWDRTFDREFEQWTGGGMVRARRLLSDGETRAEFGGRADFSRTDGASAGLIPDRNAGGGFVALDHSALLGGDWRVEYDLTARAFPDSILRDHLEHAIDASWRQESGLGSAWSADLGGERRTPIYDAPTSRDRFTDGRLGVERTSRASDRVVLRARLEGEAFAYDRPDSALYFDYQVVRGLAEARLEGGGAWTVGVGPTGELLFSGWNPAEAYREIGGALRVEYLGAHAWWSVAPSAGWRAYDAAAADGVGLHSAFAYYELDVFAEQALPIGTRVRVNLTARLENHVDASQDARSLYFSLDLRRLFPPLP